MNVKWHGLLRGLSVLFPFSIHEETNRKETEHQEKVKDTHALKYLVLKIIGQI